MMQQREITLSEIHRTAVHIVIPVKSYTRLIFFNKRIKLRNFNYAEMYMKISRNTDK